MTWTEYISIPPSIRFLSPQTTWITRGSTWCGTSQLAQRVVRRFYLAAHTTRPLTAPQGMDGLLAAAEYDSVPSGICAVN